MNFNTSQQKAILHKDGPMLVLAGPGSGKTAVITQRTYNLISKEQVDPSQILVITFTRAAAAEMKQRFEKLIQQKTKVSFGTFHAVFFTVLKSAYHFSAANIITEEQKYRFMRKILSDSGIEYQDEGEMIRSVFGEISTIKNGQIPLENYYSTSCGEEIFRTIYRSYERILRENRLIDYDDMLTYTYELFRERQDILSAWQKKYRYILIDEFQDINRIQYEIIRMMALPENNLFIVGDDDQSIYRFRGAMPEIMMNFTKDYPQAREVLLDVNYRCSGKIVKASLNLISWNRERFFKKIKASNEEGSDIGLLLFHDRAEEMKYVAREIKRLHEEGRPYASFAVLFRTNSQPGPLTEQLLEENIPFRTKDQVTNIYDHWIAGDLFAYLRLAAGGRKREDVLQIMNRPLRYISRDSLTEPQVDFGKWEAYYKDQPWIAERIRRLKEELDLMASMSPYAAINYIRKGVGYDEYIRKFAEDRNLDKSELTDLLSEIHLQAKGFRSYEKWKEHIREYSAEMKKIAADRSEIKDAVTLATLHSAKGLEFDTVFLIDVNEGIMPYKKAVLQKDVEEERRLFYVGMTRAKTQLFLCAEDSGGSGSAVSRFAEEMKKEDPKSHGIE